MVKSGDQVKSEEAIRLRDSGRVEEAKEAMEANAAYLQENAELLQSEALAGYGDAVADDAESIEDEEEWSSTRKQMIDDQHENRSQQSY